MYRFYKNFLKKRGGLSRYLNVEIFFHLFVVSSLSMNPASSAIAEVRVADFLEWAMPSQVAKVEKTYDKVIGEKVNWGFYSSGGDMTKAMVKGDIDIAFSQGLTPFVVAVNQGIPIKMVGIAMVETAHDCIVRNALGITKNNAKELEGKRIAVTNTSMAEFGLRQTLKYLNVDINKVELVNVKPADAAFMMLETEVDAACSYGQNSLSKMRRVGSSLLTNAEKEDAGVISIDVISVTEKFMKEKPEALRRFLKVTFDSNAAFAKDQSKIGIIANDAGLSVDKAVEQMKFFTFPTVEEQFNSYFNDDGIAINLLSLMGEMFATSQHPKKADYSQFIDTSFLK